MQIVIDIPNEMYDWYDNGFPDEDDAEKLWQIIKNGTLLPKEYGRLIDADNVITEAKNKMKYGINHKYMECVIAHMNLAPTIIEANEVESEE